MRQGKAAGPSGIIAEKLLMWKTLSWTYIRYSFISRMAMDSDWEKLGIKQKLYPVSQFVRTALTQ